MKRTLLKFSSVVYLISFRKFSKAKYWEINLNDLTIICDCSEKEAQFACRDFRAVILTPEEYMPSVGKIGEMGFPQAAHSLSA